MTWGTWGKNLNPHEMSDMINFCLDHGINSFDHADIYGGYTTEETFGEGLQLSGIQRDSVRLISKCGIQYPSEKRKLRVKYYEYTSDYIVESVNNSLQNLKTDYLDMLLLHRPSPLMDPGEISKAVETLMKAGKIVDFGVSNFTNSQIDLIRNKVPMSANQIQFSLTHPDAMTNGALDHMMLHDIMPMAWNPLGNVFREENEQSARIKKALVEMMIKYDVPADVLLLAWIMKHPAGIRPVFGTVSRERIAQIPKAAEIQMTTEDWFVLWAESRGVKVP